MKTALAVGIADDYNSFGFMTPTERNIIFGYSA